MTVSAPARSMATQRTQKWQRSFVVAPFWIVTLQLHPAPLPDPSLPVKGHAGAAKTQGWEQRATCENDGHALSCGCKDVVVPALPGQPPVTVQGQHTEKCPWQTCQVRHPGYSRSVRIPIHDARTHATHIHTHKHEHTQTQT